MLILNLTKSAAGQYPAIQVYSGPEIPAGYAWWPNSLEQDTFEQYEGFIIPNIKRGTVASYQPNTEAWESWQASRPPEPEPEPGEGETGGEDESIPAFVQPTGAHDAYQTGDRVTYNGHIYESTINNNVWSPDTYPQGWTELGPVGGSYIEEDA